MPAATIAAGGVLSRRAPGYRGAAPDDTARRCPDRAEARPLKSTRYAIPALLALLGGCSSHSTPAPSVAAGPQARVYAIDLTGGAKVCKVAPVKLAVGTTTQASMALKNDGGWCAITVARAGKPYAAGLLTEAPSHGRVYIHTVGDATRIDYTPHLGFVGTDHFSVTLLPDQAVIDATAKVSG